MGSDTKAAIAISHGLDPVIFGRDADFAAEMSRLTQGCGVDFAIDGIGGSILDKTLECVRRFSTVASVGEASGPIAPLAVEAIDPLRSLSFARPSVMYYAADRVTYASASGAVVRLMDAGIAAPIGRRYLLSDARQAHADLEAGLFSGAAILLPR